MATNLMTTRQQAEAIVADAAATFDVSVAQLRKARLFAEQVAARRYANRQLMEHLPRLSARQRASYLGVCLNTVHKWSAGARGRR